MEGELNGILGWVEQLGQVDVTGVEPMTAVIPNTLRLRDDIVDADPLTGGGRRKDVLANAPEPPRGFFRVPKVIEICASPPLTGLPLACRRTVLTQRSNTRNTLR